LRKLNTQEYEHEIRNAKELLVQISEVRPAVLRQALIKIKAGTYLGEETVEKAAITIMTTTNLSS
jgi:hypothetical protein